MSSQPEITATTSANTVIVGLEYPTNSLVSYNFKLEICIFEQKIQNGNRSDVNVYRNVFYVQHNKVEVTDLKFQTMYRVQATIQYGENNKVKNVYVYTRTKNQQDKQEDEVEDFQQPQPLRPRPQSSQRPNSDKIGSNYPKSNNQLCNSQLLMKTLAESSRMRNKSQAHKYILQSRKCRNTKQFINEKHGRRVDPAAVSDKRMLVIQGKILFDEIYKYREGCRFFRNQWAMGPFYSYDYNENQLKK